MRYNRTPLPQSRQIFVDWYNASSFGQALQSLEASYLQSALKLTYNHKTLQVGRTGSETLYIDTAFLADFVVVEPSPPLRHSNISRIVGAASELPIASESIDTLIIPHVIEFDCERHQILQEAERVLRPEGRLIVLCLNPLSIHGIIQYLPHTASYWRTNFVTSRRLLDWLSLLKFDSEYGAAFSIASTNTILRPATLLERARAEISFAYTITAIKRRYSVIPFHSTWVPVPSLATEAMFERVERTGN